MRYYDLISFSHFSAALLFLCVVSYGLFEGRWMVLGPEITITSNTAPIASSTYILSGTTFHATSLTVNGATIFITPDGHFSDIYALTPGANLFAIDARDRYGHSVHTMIMIMSTASSSTASIPPLASSTSATSSLATTTATSSAAHHEHRSSTTSPDILQ